MLLALHTELSSGVGGPGTTPNAVVIGPTGSGKTLTFQVAAETLGVPFVAIDTTSLVPSGIVGVQLEDVISDLVDEADEILERSGVKRSRGDEIRLASRGVVFLDEFDKIRSGSGNPVQNQQVQRRLLKLCEGAPQPIAVRTHHETSSTPQIMDSRHLLVVAAGAFDGLDHSKATSNDLTAFGLIPELVARFPVLIRYDALSIDDLVEVLADSEASPLAMWRRYALAHNRELIVQEDALRFLASTAIDAGLGARGLHQAVFPALTRIVSAEMALDRQDPIVIDAERLSAEQ